MALFSMKGGAWKWVGVFGAILLLLMLIEKALAFYAAAKPAPAA